MQGKSSITTHVLDTALGKPARGIEVILERCDDAGYVQIASGQTDADGRITDLLTPGAIATGTYRIHFALEAYYADAPHFFPEASIVFRVDDADAHYHVPLLLSPFGFSTYRGS